MIYYQDKYVSIRRPYGNSSFLRLDWKSETRLLSDAHFRNIMVILLDILEEKNVKKILANGMDNQYMMSPDTLMWHQREIIPAYEYLSINRMAFVLNTDLLAHLSFESSFQTNARRISPSIKFFSSEYDAIRWLLD